MAFLRKLAIAAVRLLHNPLDQVISVAAILLVNIAATAQCDPYEEQYLDYMELVALSCNLMILFSGYLFYSDLLSSWETQVAGVLIVILMAGSIVAMVKNTYQVPGSSRSVPSRHIGPGNFAGVGQELILIN